MPTHGRFTKKKKDPVKTATPKKGYLQKKIQQHQKQISHKRGR